MQIVILLKMSLSLILQNINCKTLQGQKGHNNGHDSISQESPQSNRYKMSSFIFITKHYACRNSSYLNGVLRVINATNGHSRERKKAIKTRIKRRLQMSDIISVNRNAVKIKLSALITTRCCWTCQKIIAIIIRHGLTPMNTYTYREAEEGAMWNSFPNNLCAREYPREYTLPKRK